MGYEAYVHADESSVLQLESQGAKFLDQGLDLITRTFRNYGYEAHVMSMQTDPWFVANVYFHCGMLF